MDRNTLIGLVLILGILFTFQYLNTDSPEEIKAKQEQREAIRIQDSINEITASTLAISKNSQTELIPTVIDSSLSQLEKDSILAITNLKFASKYDVFAASAAGQKEYYSIENDDLRITISSKGGKVIKAELKKYQNYENYMIAKDSLKDTPAKDLPILKPIQLFDEDSSDMYFTLNTVNKIKISTADLYFVPVTEGKDKLVLRAKTNNEAGFIEMKYALEENYNVGFSLDLVGLDNVVDGSDLYFNWEMKSLLTEKEAEGQSRMSSVFYKPKDDGRTYLSELSEDSDELESPTNWVAFKHCYFSSAIISEEGFKKGGEVFSQPIKTAKYSDEYRASLNVSTNIDNRTSIPMTFFFGPNDYDILASHSNEMEDIIDLGWGIFRWTAKWLIKPIFNFLNGFNIAMGLIILILTIVVRLIILPLTYKNYKSSAKMKVLKPEITEINEKFKDGDAAEKQRETMALYRKTGVNPMAGCLPIFIQMPILLAVFRFFPSSIDLRQRSFLWAEDLSTYESVMELGFHIPAYGSHVSMFTLLLCISTIFYTRMNSSQMSMPSQPGMPNMKVIMYLMPLMMLFFLNNYAAGLTFYYFCGNLITMGLMLLVKHYFIDEKKIRATIEANKTKPKKQSASSNKSKKLRRSNWKTFCINQIKIKYYEKCTVYIFDCWISINVL
jgi:YidC/Oxa1 family membrane protein insertase